MRKRLARLGFGIPFGMLLCGRAVVLASRQGNINDAMAIGIPALFCGLMLLGEIIVAIWPGTANGSDGAQEPDTGGAKK